MVDVERGLVSKPSLLKQRVSVTVSSDQIRSYKTIRSIADKNRVIGVLILTKDDRKFRYSDKRTPGVSRTVLKLLSKSGAAEQLDGRQLIG